jgi:hypothetical protein
MLRRTAVSALWFVSILCLHELAWSVAGSPRPLGIVLGALAAAFVWFDPLGQFHPLSRPSLPNGTSSRLVPKPGSAECPA